MIELSSLTLGKVYEFTIAEETTPDGGVIPAEKKTRRYVGSREIDKKLFLRVEHITGKAHLIWLPSIERAELAPAFADSTAGA